jgi:hypothetical protein
VLEDDRDVDGAFDVDGLLVVDGAARWALPLHAASRRTTTSEIRPGPW